MGRVALLALALVVRNDRARAPLTWDDVVESYDHVRDYTALYEKVERAISHGEPQKIRLSFRKPLDVRLDWLGDRSTVDQVAVYRAGFNDGKVLARRSGLLGGLAGTIRVDPRDRLALQDSRHPITEVGLGHIIEQVAQDSRSGRIAARDAVADTLDGRPAYRFDFDAISTAGLLGVDGARRASIWVDPELKLPDNVEVRDANNTLLERHRFQELRLNIGLTDRTFSL